MHTVVVHGGDCRDVYNKFWSRAFTRFVTRMPTTRVVTRPMNRKRIAISYKASCTTRAFVLQTSCFLELLRFLRTFEVQGGELI